jgi:hypothetical protein
MIVFSLQSFSRRSVVAATSEMWKKKFVRVIDGSNIEAVDVFLRAEHLENSCKTRKHVGPGNVSVCANARVQQMSIPQLERQLKHNDHRSSAWWGG